MARDGNGDFSRSVTPPSNGDIADADDYNAEQNDVASALSDSINKNGTKAFAANQPMGGFKLTGLGAGVNNGDSVRFEQLAASIAAAVGVTVQGLDATLTALAALSWASGNALVQFTAADTVSLTLTPSVTNITVSGIVSAPDGSAAAPSIKVGDEQNGLFSGAANSLDFATAGAHRWRLNSAGGLRAQGNFSIYAGSGTVSAPGISFEADDDCGWYRIGVNNWAGAVGGAKFVDISTSLVAYSLPVQASTAISSETSGALTSASRNRIVQCSGNITLPSSGMTDGDVILIDPRGTARTVTRPGSHTMYIAGADSATGTTGAHNIVTAMYHGSSKWTLQGSVA